MARSEPIRKYVEIGIAIVCIVGVSAGISWLTEPEINKGDVGALIGAIAGFLTAISSLYSIRAKAADDC